MRKISWQWCTGSEQRDRKENEDRGWSGEVHLADGTKACVAAVSDGVGGAVHGAEVAAMAIEALKIALKKAFRGTFQREDLFRAWCDGLTGRLVADLAKTYPDGGATLSVVIRAGRHVAVAWVGDSPIWRVGRERVERWFKPHTKAQELLDAGVDEDDIPPRAYSSLMKSISADEGDGKGLLDCQIHIGNVASWLVVGSDGVFNHIGGSELREIAETGGKRGAAGIMRALLAKSLKNGRAGGKPLDNATASVLSWNHRRPVFGTPTMWVPTLPEGGWKRNDLPGRLRYACIALIVLLLGLGVGFGLWLAGRKDDGEVLRNGRIPGTNRAPGGGFGGGGSVQEQPLDQDDNSADEDKQKAQDDESANPPQTNESRSAIFTNNSPWVVVFSDGTTTSNVPPGGTIETNWIPVGAELGSTFGDDGTRIRGLDLRTVQPPTVELAFSDEFYFSSGIHALRWQTNSSGHVNTQLSEQLKGYLADRLRLKKILENCVKLKSSLKNDGYESTATWSADEFVAGMTNVLTMTATRKPDVFNELKNENRFTILVDGEELNAGGVIHLASWPPKSLAVKDDHVNQWACTNVPPDNVSTVKGTTNTYTVTVQENPKPIIVVTNSGPVPMVFDWNGREQMVAVNDRLRLESDGAAHDFVFRAYANDTNYADHLRAYDWTPIRTNIAPKYGETLTIEVPSNSNNLHGDIAVGHGNPWTVIELRLSGGLAFNATSRMQASEREGMRVVIFPFPQKYEGKPEEFKAHIESQIKVPEGCDLEKTWRPEQFELGTTNVLTATVISR